MHSEII